MAQLTSLWPLLMLLALGLLGRKLTAASLLLIVAVVLPIITLFAVGFVRREFFEARYFASVVPLLFLLTARGVTAVATDRRGVLLVVGALVGTLVLGLFDQQLGSGNPRRFDFRGALDQVSKEMQPGDLLLYEPLFSGTVVKYYSPQLPSSPLESGLPSTASGRIFLMASFLDQPEYADNTRTAVDKLKHTLIRERQWSGVHLWVFQ